MFASPAEHLFNAMQGDSPSVGAEIALQYSSYERFCRGSDDDRNDWPKLPSINVTPRDVRRAFWISVLLFDEPCPSNNHGIGGA